MSINYSQTAINDRLLGVVTAIGAAGKFKLFAGATLVSTITLNSPSCGTVSGGVLTFTGSLSDPAAASTGLVDSAQITDAFGNAMISGLTVGIPLSGRDVIINNNSNSTLIQAGQSVLLSGAQIIGS